MQWQVLCFMLSDGTFSGPLGRIGPCSAASRIWRPISPVAMAGHWAKCTDGISTRPKNAVLLGIYELVLSIHLVCTWHSVKRKRKRKREEIKMIPNIYRFISAPFLNIYQSRNHLTLVVLLLQIGITCKDLK